MVEHGRVEEVERAQNQTCPTSEVSTIVTPNNTAPYVQAVRYEAAR